MVASLFMIGFGSKVGYAISRLERIFGDVFLELAENDRSKVHFSYRDLSGGPPAIAQRGYENWLAFDPSRLDDARNVSRLTDYVRENRIGLVVPLDMQPVGPLVRILRTAGVGTIVPYWGAPISSPSPLWKRVLKRSGILVSRSRADGLIFESRAMADLAIVGRGVPARMVDVVPLGIDMSEIPAPEPDYVRREFDLPVSRRIVVYAGHMDERKGVRVLVDAALELLARRDDVCFLLCGNRDGEAEPYQRRYRGSPAAAWIHFGGYRADLLKLYAGCYCGVIPSTGWDSFTYASLEMAACGLPIVASRLQGLQEAVEDNETGLHFTPGDSHELAGQLAELLDSPLRARQLGDRGRKRCEQELTVDHQKDSLVKVLLRRLDGSR